MFDNEIYTKCKKWQYSSECKPIPNTEVDSIPALKVAFHNPIQDALDTCNDGYPNEH